MKLESSFQPATPERMSTYVSEYGSVLYHEGNFHAVSADGDLDVPIPSDVAEHIVLAMKLQDKAINDDQDALHVLQTFNCRKSALVVSGAISLEESIVEMSNDSGEDVMLQDVDRVLRLNDGSVSELSNYADFKDVLHEYEGSFPAIVHIFESEEPIEIASFSELVATLHRVHSFVVLGEDDGGYVCFQKMGPDTDQPFIICDLEVITSLYSNQKNRTGYFVYGPYK